jgi:hypothetical protein
VNNVVWLVAAKSGRFFGRDMAAGDSYLIAGNGTLSYAGDGGPAVKAEFAVDEGSVLTFDPRATSWWPTRPTSG